MKNNEFKELVDRDLSGLEWDERKRLRVLHAISEEERPMKKKISFTAILVAAILCLTVTAVAAGLVFSRKVNDLTLARQEMEKAYGITPTMLGSYFSEMVEQGSDETVVTYWNNNEMNAVLGEYTVTVKDGKATAHWDRDGEDTSGGFKADTWGIDQLNAMVEWEKEHHDVSGYYPQAKAIAAKREAKASSQKELFDKGKEDATKHQEEYEQQARAAAKLTEEEMIGIARQALVSVYGLTDEQMAMLETDEEIRENSCYWMLDGKPVYDVWFWLLQDKTEYDDPSVFPEFTEKDGIYIVDVNVETGVIEDIYYESGMGGNG